MEKSGMVVVPWQTDDAISQVDNGVGANSLSKLGAHYRSESDLS